jgi:hypothetical protein
LKAEAELEEYLSKWPVIRENIIANFPELTIADQAEFLLRLGILLLRNYKKADREEGKLKVELPPAGRKGRRGEP